MMRYSRPSILSLRARRRSATRALIMAFALTTIASTFGSTAAQAAQFQIGADDFSRPDGAGWGTAAQGGEYTLTGSADFAVAGGKGVIRDLAPGTSAGAYLSAVSARDTLVQSVVRVPAGDLSALKLHQTVEARRQSDGSAYRGRVLIGNGGSLAVSVSRVNGGTDTGLGSVPLAQRVTAGADLSLQLQVTGTSPVTLSVRAWLAGGSAPAWQQTVTDTDAARLTAAGGVGVWDYLSGASPAVTVTHDSFAAYDVAATPTATATALASTVTTYKSTTFDSMATGAVNPSAFISAVGSTNTNASAYNDMTVITDSRGGKSIRTTLKAGTIHSKPSPGDNGDNLFVALPSSYDQACVQYDIRFDSNFDWSLGGKLPGLLGVAPGTAPSTPTGGGKTEMGWSGRLMWLGPKAYSWAGPTNMAVSYMYHSGQAGTYGDNIRWNKPFVAGKWHTVKQCYKMNTIGQSNGYLKAWMDGQQVVNITNFKYRSRSDVKITHLSFALFRGGGTLDWAGSRTGYVDIDNLKITNS